MRYEVTCHLDTMVTFNVEADSDEEAIQKIKDTQPTFFNSKSTVTWWSAQWEPNL